MEASITIEDRQVRVLLAQTPERIQRAMLGGMTDATVYLVNQMRTYPPQRPGSRYVRTNTLKGSWNRFIEGNGVDLVGRVSSNGNIAPYNVYVQDRTRQAAPHRGVWTNTVQGVAERSAATVNAMFQARIQAATGG